MPTIYATLDDALAAGAAGDNFWVSEDHAESSAASLPLACPGTKSNPCAIICVDHAGSVPPVSADYRTSATVTSTGAHEVNPSGYAYVYGITVSWGGGGANASIFRCGGGAMVWNMDTCALQCASTLSSENAGIELGHSADNSDCAFRWKNTTVKFGAEGQGITSGPPSGLLEWTSTQAAIDVTGSIPSALFLSDNTLNGRTNVLIKGVDLSGLGSGSYCGGSGFQTSIHNLVGCKLNAAFSIGSTPGGATASISLVDCDSGAINYRRERWTNKGSDVIETTIVRSGGASDGTTPASAKIVTTANSSWLFPFTGIPLAVWNDTTGSNVTITVYGIWGGGAVPNNDDIWIEVQYMGSAGSPIFTVNSANTKADFLASNAAQTADLVSTWGGGTTAFKMVVTLSSPQPAMRGWIYIYPKAAKPSTTFYVDRKPLLS